MARRSALVTEALSTKPRGRAPQLTVVAEEVDVLEVENENTARDDADTPEEHATVTQPPAPTSAQAPSPVDERLWRRTRGLGDAIAVTINIPRALDNRINQLSKTMAASGERQYLRGINRNALLNAAAERVANKPNRYNKPLPEGDVNTRLAGELPDALHAQVLATVWALDPKPATHGPLLANAIDEILNENGG